MQDLYHLCRWNECALVKEVLKNDVIDVTDDDGILFSITIGRNYVKMTSILLKYYEKHKLQGDHETIAYKVAKYRINNVLQEMADRGDLSAEMKDLLKPYIRESDSDTDREELF